MKYNSTWALEGRGFDIISEPKIIELPDSFLVFLPYTLEADRKALEDYLPKTEKKIICFSHNDIAGIQYGVMESKEGFKIAEIENDCSLFLNGHLHNGGWFCKNGFNLGNLTGQNFNENATKYIHSSFILDTDTLALTSFENPYAFNFYQFDVYKEKDLLQLDNIKDHAVIQIKYAESLKDELDLKLSSLSQKIIASRLLVFRDIITDENALQQIQAVNHLKQFCEFSVDRLGNSNLLQSELSKIVA